MRPARANSGSLVALLARAVRPQLVGLAAWRAISKSFLDKCGEDAKRRRLICGGFARNLGKTKRRVIAQDLEDRANLANRARGVPNRQSQGAPLDR